MTRLLLDTFLILLGSFFVGCAIACVFRRMFFREARPIDIPHTMHRPVVVPAPIPRPAVAPAEAAPFERALGGGTVTATARSSGHHGHGPVVEVEPPAPKLTPAPALPAAPASIQPVPAPVAPVRPAPPPQPQSVQMTASATTPAPQPAQVPSPPPSVSSAAAATAAALATAAAAAAARPADSTAPNPAPSATAVPVGPAAFEGVVNKVAQSTSMPAPVGAPAASPPQAAPVATVAVGPADDLMRIRAIDADLQARLNRLGVSRYAEIAAWNARDVSRMSQSLGFAGRIEQENWIEQAQILARGDETAFSRRRSQGMAPQDSVQQPASAAPVAPQQSASSSASTATAAAAAAAASIASASMRPATSAAPVAATPAPVPAPVADGDKLHRILGINADAERILHANGVTRFAQIAAWNAEDAARFDGLLASPGRIGRENWIEQAKVLIRPAGDAGANRPVQLADAIRDNAPRVPRGDLGNLRSVKSEALRGDGGTADARPSILTRTVGSYEDLKRIRGVGVLIEKKLNSLGITAYEQVANWTSADIDRISQILDFKGRIERENWVEQARILAAGGHTEFSRRVDRGDVDSSKR